MPNVKNKKAISNLSHRILAANRVRNLVAVLAIALTATLFTALFTIGGSIVATMQNATMHQVGTRAHGGFKFLTQAQYDTLAADPKLKDISYNIMVGIAENPELEKTYTEIRYTEAKAADWSFCTPTTGTLPQEKYDLACSTKVLDALGLPHTLGQTVHLEFTSGGKARSQDFTLCGYWDGDVALGASEAFVSHEYCDEVAPAPDRPLYESGSSDMSGTINPSFWFASAFDIDAQVEALETRCGFDNRVNSGVNWAYTTSNVDAQSLVLMAAGLLLVLVSGYLIIYNVFRISVSGDIRFYGLLKTIGTTPRQLRRIVRGQALALCIAGIPLGLAAGFGVGCLVMPVVIRTTNVAANFVLTANPLIFAGAALFALFTVLISCIRPCRMAGRVSPIEALRFTGSETMPTNLKRRRTHKVSPFTMACASLRRERKKAILVIASLTLSLTLLSGTYTVVTGFDLDKYVENSSVSDFSLTDASLRGARAQVEDINGIPEDTLDAVRALDGCEDAGGVWAAGLYHTLSDEAFARTEQIVEKNAEELPSPYADTNLEMFRNDRQLMGFCYGVDPFLWDKLELAKDATFDAEKFASGDYVIVSAFWDDGEDPYYRPGDTVTIDFDNGHSKTYTVLALGTIPYALSQQFGNYLEIDFTLPADEYARQMGDTQAMSVGFDVDDTHLAAAERWCEAYTTDAADNLVFTSRETLKDQFRGTQGMMIAVGGALSILLGLIGILNFANAIITSISARRHELAVLQSVGMTGRQVRTMLCSEGLVYASATLLLAATAGNALVYLAVNMMAEDMWFLHYHFTLLPLAICAPVLVLLAAAIPALACRLTMRQSVVERLRDAA